MVSAGAIGATGMFAPLAGIAPRLVRALYDLCRQDKLFEARAPQEQIAALRQAVKPGGVASLKAAHARDGPRLRRAAAADCSLSTPSPIRSSSASSMRSRRCATSRAAGERQTTVRPPSRTSVWPVIDAACGLAR